ncbi:MAG: ROK family protein [Polyangiaceae bacterium]|nr:ROK family protein [Polyangiaceae bacterium]
MLAPDGQPSPLLVGLDLGGSKIEAAVLRRTHNGSLEVTLRKRIPTERDRGYEAVLARTASLLNEVIGEAGADRATVPIGVGMPGGVTRAGLIKNSNTVCLNGRPFREDLCRALGGRSIAFENDANCFALAEARMGAAAAWIDGVVFGVILGTGAGGGLVLKGTVWPGAQGIAGEWGHHAVWPDRGPTCYCGQRGCLEVFASGPAVERDYRERSGKALPLAEIARRRAEDPHAREAVEGLIDTFGRGLANVIDILDPSAIVIGGGVSNLGILYTEGAARVARYVFNDELTTPILKNTLGDSSGVLGAALLNEPAAGAAFGSGFGSGSASR